MDITKIVPDFDPEFHDKRTTAMLLASVAHPVYSAMANRQARHIGPYNNEDVTQLQSKPGSPWVFYLNISSVMSGSTPLNGVTKENMYRAWQSIADQYSMLNLNVTTNRAVYDTARACQPAAHRYHQFRQPGWPLVRAPVLVRYHRGLSTLYRNPSSGWDYGYGIGMTGAHEVGHQMGMNHDHGGTGGEYFEGIAAYQWGPIMGNYWMGGSWANQLFTWSKGEYTTASNFEDDLNIMTTQEQVPYMADDNPTSKALVFRRHGADRPAQQFRPDRTHQRYRYLYLHHLGHLDPEPAHRSARIPAHARRRRDDLQRVQCRCRAQQYGGAPFGPVHQSVSA
ncbi:hypothetical protein LP420_36505 [Massilia sp. B-10]|nr:hypothetical protein LP420_36505 [Massilia sp. B-10]